MLFSVLDLKHLRIRIYNSNGGKKSLKCWFPHPLAISTNGADFFGSNTEEERMNCVQCTPQICDKIKPMKPFDACLLTEGSEGA